MNLKCGGVASRILLLRCMLSLIQSGGAVEHKPEDVWVNGRSEVSSAGLGRSDIFPLPAYSGAPPTRRESRSDRRERNFRSAVDEVAMSLNALAASRAGHGYKHAPLAINSKNHAGRVARGTIASRSDPFMPKPPLREYRNALPDLLRSTDIYCLGQYASS